MQSSFWSAWESIRTETLEPCAGAVVTRGPCCFRSCPCTHLNWVLLSFWFLTHLSFFVSFSCPFHFLTYLYLPGLLLDNVWCLDFGIKPLALTFPCQFRSIFSCSWFLYLDSKCWYECTTSTGASTWSALLDLNTSRDWKFQWVLEIHFEK